MKFLILPKRFECVHNLIYWKNGEYIGVGAGSHSKIDSKRFWNIRNIEEYVSALKTDRSHIEGYENIDIDEDMWETIFLGLRLNEGVNIDEFNKRYDKDFMFIYGNVVFELVDKGLLKINGQNIVLTDKGRDLSNIVFIKFSK